MLTTCRTQPFARKEWSLACTINDNLPLMISVSLYTHILLSIVHDNPPTMRLSYLSVDCHKTPYKQKAKTILVLKLYTGCSITTIEIQTFQYLIGILEWGATM